jgi:hypothetical protein
MEKDRVLYPLIDKAIAMVASGRLVEAVEKEVSLS